MSSLSRRRLLHLGASAGAATLAGCLNSATSTDQQTTTQPPTSTAEPLSCPPTPRSTNLSIPAWPEKPDSFTRETAAAYAVQLEDAYATRKAVQDMEDVVFVSVRVTIDEGEATVTDTEGGWVVTFEVLGPAIRYRQNADSTEPAHIDPPLYGVGYFLSATETRRQTALDPTAPRENGRPLTCPPE